MEKLNVTNFGVVYVVINYEFNIIKIGVSRDVPNRMIGLKCACGCDLEVLYTTKPINNYFEIEKMAHEEFKYCRREYGEWFNVEAGLVIRFISKLVSEKNVHPIINYYQGESTISNIADMYGVSRAYITKLLKQWNCYKREILVSFKEKCPSISKDKPKDTVPAKYRRASKYIRIKENLYKHHTDEVYKTKEFKDGKLFELFFSSKDDALDSLSGFV